MNKLTLICSIMMVVNRDRVSDELDLKVTMFFKLEVWRLYRISYYLMQPAKKNDEVDFGKLLF